jgi:hypothetical protein
VNRRLFLAAIASVSAAPGARRPRPALAINRIPRFMLALGQGSPRNVRWTSAEDLSVWRPSQTESLALTSKAPFITRR